MKTKNILLSALTVALLASPLLAQVQDIHEEEIARNAGQVGSYVAKTVVANQEEKDKEKYLDIGTLYNFLNEDIPVDLEKLLKKATNSINDNKITPKEQYDLMLFCIEHNEYEILETLLKAGFNPKINADGTDSTSYQLFNRAIELGYGDIAELILTYISKSHVKATEFTRYDKGIKPKEIKKKMKDIEDDLADKNIIAAYYYTSSGMLVIKQWENPITEQQFQEWLEKNESMMLTNNNAAVMKGLNVAEDVKNQIRLFKKINMNGPFIPKDPKLNFEPIEPGIPKSRQPNCHQDQATNW